MAEHFVAAGLHVAKVQAFDDDGAGRQQDMVRGSARCQKGSTDK